MVDSGSFLVETILIAWTGLALGVSAFFAKRIAKFAQAHSRWLAEQKTRGVQFAFFIILGLLLLSALPMLIGPVSSLFTNDDPDAARPPSKYRVYTDPDQSFSVDLPSALTVREHLKSVPVEGSGTVEARVHVASSNTKLGFGITTYRWDVGAAPKEFVSARLRAFFAGSGGTLASTQFVERPGCTAIRGVGRAIVNGSPRQLMAEICIRGDRVFGLYVLSTAKGTGIEKRPSVHRFFASFEPLQ